MLCFTFSSAIASFEKSANDLVMDIDNQHLKTMLVEEGEKIIHHVSEMSTLMGSEEKGKGFLQHFAQLSLNFFRNLSWNSGRNLFHPRFILFSFEKINYIELPQTTQKPYQLDCP